MHGLDTVAYRGTAVRWRGIGAGGDLRHRTRTRRPRACYTAGLPVPARNPNDVKYGSWNTGSNG